MELTDDEVIRRWAKRDDYRLEYHICTGLRLWKHGIEMDGQRYQRVIADNIPNKWSELHKHGLPDYFNSHDAQFPVIEKLTPEEWEKLAYLEDDSVTDGAINVVQYIMTLPAPTKARLIAKVFGRIAHERS